MKLISLNIWGGAAHDTFITFIKEHSADTDIFCFQEVYTSSENAVSRGTHLNIFEELQSLLPDFQSFFAPIQDNIDEEGTIATPTVFGSGTFIRKSHKVEGNNFVFAYRGQNTFENDDLSTLGAGFHHFSILMNGESLTVVNMYGTSTPGDKLDTPARLAQLKVLKEFLARVAGPKIVCGDFNLSPETRSIMMLEETMKNLIKEFSIRTTRSILNEKKYVGQTIQRFADYTFVSPDIKINSFEVPNIPVSDHLPMILEFSLV